jgi:hypothetical protein
MAYGQGTAVQQAAAGPANRTRAAMKTQAAAPRALNEKPFSTENDRFISVTLLVVGPEIVDR